ncbi:ATP-binding protein [Brevibacillus sp. WF146]|uniref:sensor histidine kinase n=1 Tax=Brevibacillus sp. WF146 TaxID=319501 RepID=UPI0007EC3130|nr:ATP-binding protein [Brevibacillus sp. WF146]UYZ15168.1 ATP-binding protein [Brevibacillus sp. WF146]
MWRLRKNLVGFWTKSIIWKLVLINALVIGLVIWIAGVTVKDFACYLVNQNQFSGNVNSELFNSTMRDYLIRASVIAAATAAIIHYFLARRIVTRLRQLAFFFRQIMNGVYPEPITKRSNDEIGQLAQNCNQLVQVMRQGEERRKQMISDISHELRTPLSNIKGYLEALREGVINGNKELYHSLYEEAVHFSDLVDQLHQLSAWEAKKMREADLQIIDIFSFVETSVRHFEMELKNKNILCPVKLQPATVLADPMGLKQIVNNLMKNAIQYDEGGVIEVYGELAGKEYRIMIKNSGREIPPQKAKQIFERFFRLEPSRNRETGGSGLGLAIVKEIVSRHGGKVGLQTNGKVHSFWFSLPVYCSQTEEAKKSNYYHFKEEHVCQNVVLIHPTWKNWIIRSAEKLFRQKKY